MAAPTTPLIPARRLRLPGLLEAVPGVETYWVRPGGVTAVRVHGGDEITVVDRQGRQRAEVTALGPTGDGAERSSTRSGGAVARDLLGLTADAPATVLRALGASASPHAVEDPVLATLLAHGLDPTELRAALLFGEWSPAGSRETLRAVGPGIVLVAAPGRPMAVDETTATRRPTWCSRCGAPSRGCPRSRRCRPRSRSRCSSLRRCRHRLSYEVQAGQYIQILDVEGRQCSDFLAFHARRLAEGLELGLDATATRTMGQAYPQPGLHGKFYDQQGRLVEIVRDTVGRHDTFGLACTTKYYEDLGYSGTSTAPTTSTPSCARSASARAVGWPALNLFYNTAFDAKNQLISDEPWSRAGDYVLMRAGTDLVCASSACPDDIDPANGWVPDRRTRARLRLDEEVLRGDGPPGDPGRRPRAHKKTGFATRTDALTRQFTDYRGYWLPTSFRRLRRQQRVLGVPRARGRDGPVRVAQVRDLGPDAEALLQQTLTRDIRRLSIGQVVYSAMCTDTGGMIDDCTVFRLGETNFRFVGGDRL